MELRGATKDELANAYHQWTEPDAAAEHFGAVASDLGRTEAPLPHWLRGA